MENKFSDFSTLYSETLSNIPAIEKAVTERPGYRRSTVFSSAKSVQSNAAKPVVPRARRPYVPYTKTRSLISAVKAPSDTNNSTGITDSNSSGSNGVAMEVEDMRQTIGELDQDTSLLTLQVDLDAFDSDLDRLETFID